MPPLKLYHYTSLEGPYTHIDLSTAKKNLPIDEIIIGPTSHMNLPLVSLQYFLDSNKVACDIIPSQVPYRAW